MSGEQAKPRPSKRNLGLEETKTMLPSGAPAPAQSAADLPTGVADLPGDVTSMPFFQKQSLEGKQIESWRLEALLGVGGMSAVYLGKHLWLQQEAAIKVLLPEYSRDLTVLHRFQQEASAVSRLKHPNIIEVSDFGVDENFGFFMVLEYLQGQDLESVLSKAPFPKSWILSLFKQLCKGLKVTHDAGIIHRDLKPSNIYLLPQAPHPQVKILDFGVAKVQFQESDAKLTKTGIVVGTPAYLAPEQISPQGSTLAASDVYALGVILYQCLTKELPIKASSTVGFLLKVLQDAPTPMHLYRPELKDTQLEALVYKMLAKNPYERPQDVAEVWRLLEEAAKSFDDPRDKEEFYPRIQVAEPKARASKHLDKEEFIFDSQSEQVVASTVAAEIPETGGEEKPASSAVKLLLGICGLLLVGIGGLLASGLFRPSPPKKTKARAAPRKVAVAPGPSVLDDLVIKGRKAYDKGRYLKAARLWKRAMRQKAWGKSRYYPKLYRAIGRAYQEKNRIHSAVQYYLRYRLEVRQGQEKLKELRRKMQEIQGDSPKKQELDKALRTLLARLPTVGKFNQDLKRLDELRPALKRRKERGEKTLAQLEKAWKRRDWKRSRALLSRLRRVAPSVPRLHIRSAQLFADPFLALSLKLLSGIQRDMEPTDAQRKQIAQLQKQLKQKHDRRLKEWKEALQKASALLAKKQVSKALRWLRKPLRDPTHLAQGAMHKAWRQWLSQQSKQRPALVGGFWRLYIQTLGKIRQRGLGVWLDPKRKDAWSEKAAKQRYRGLQSLGALQRQLGRARASMERAQFGQALSLYQAALRRGAKLPQAGPNAPSASLQGALLRARTRIALLKKLISLEKQSEQAYLQARFVRATRLIQAMIAKLAGSPAQSKIKQRFSAREQQQFRAHMELTRGHQAFGKHQWAAARKHYRLYLKLFPKAYDKQRIDKRLKTCRCALNIYPWETCDKLKIPKKKKKR